MVMVGAGPPGGPTNIRTPDMSPDPHWTLDTSQIVFAFRPFVRVTQESDQNYPELSTQTRIRLSNIHAVERS